MFVIATAGHVDHGKSTLVRALTGMEPDRWAEERRRGMTIDLGFAWTALPSGRTVAFVDVPGHERFVTTMLAGVGPCPAAMIVVAADEGWCVQSGEHLAALDLLGVRHGLLVITRADLADPAPALAEARSRLRGTCLETIPALAVSGVTGQGLPELATALDRLAAGLPPTATDGPVRLWADRVFTVTGAGVVVTGTLTAGTLRAGQTLHLGGEPVRVRGLQTLNTPAGMVTATARVAVNLRGPVSPSRGDALLTPGAWHLTTSADVRLSPGEPPKGDLLLHIGSAAVPTRIRPLGEGAARLSFARPLPLRVGDRALLRDPSRSAVTTGVVVLDVRPPTLTRRGAAAARGAALAAAGASPGAGKDAPGTRDAVPGGGLPGAADLLRWHGLLSGADLATMGVTAPPSSLPGGWHADPEHWAGLRKALAEAVTGAGDGRLTVEAATHLLGLPDRRLTRALIAPPLTLEAGVIGRQDLAPPPLPAHLRQAIDRLRAELADRPFQAPSARRLAELGLAGRNLVAAERASAVLVVTAGVVLLPDAPDRAVKRLRLLPAPFTVSQARVALQTTRRVAVPLLEMLDGLGCTTRRENGSRICTAVN
ncbi:selenocysteine-specific translation elongation factor [Microtetraspora sp. NBRC 13810]|uniref:selenocysteine-specific translation elongation factor n=1 Tax=Microtetraspora sp. NBRC 13810 TaxID=3030990 RepID=UPI0024A1D2C8|nr:selenocysteine-specific translation elongation factor [Microtetraspora sp. NBRC 13810]GLW08687.1 selenocysteine-specific translation elongation factor [Microtetraspora sp. NBRC 13810]